jgi:hypothetical protein
LLSRIVPQIRAFGAGDGNFIYRVDVKEFHNCYLRKFL